MSQIVEGFKTVITFLYNVISFPIKMVRLFNGMDFDSVTNSMWWLPAGALACIVSILAIAVIFKIFGREG